MSNFSELSKGLTPGVEFFLLFTLSFRLVGHPLPLSICLGILGGLAGGSVIAWWHIEEIPNSGKPTIHLTAETASPTSKTEPKFPSQKPSLSGNTPRKAFTLVDWLFRKK